jgi:hypothetical protein
MPEIISQSRPALCACGNYHAVVTSALPQTIGGTYMVQEGVIMPAVSNNRESGTVRTTGLSAVIS